MRFLLLLLTLFFAPLAADTLDEAILRETTAIENSQDAIESASHYIERGEYYFICEHYHSASEDILDALNLLEEQEEPLRFRAFLTLGVIFANLQMDDHYFATLEHLKTSLSSKHCSRCQIWHLPATRLEPQIRTATHAFLVYAFSPMAQYSIVLFLETLEQCAYRCIQSISLWESSIAPLATKLHAWKDYEFDAQTSFELDMTDRCYSVLEGI